MTNKPSKLVTELPVDDIREPAPLTDEQVAAVSGGCLAGEAACFWLEQEVPGTWDTCNEAHKTVHRYVGGEMEPDQYRDLNNNQMCDAGDHYPES